MTGNITVPAVSISPSIIKKNHRLTLPDGSSVIGTFEGWVPTGVKNPLLTGKDFNNVESGGSGIEYGNGFIGISGRTSVTFNKSYILSDYTNLEFYAAYNKGNNDGNHYLRMEVQSPYNNEWIYINRIYTPNQENVGSWFKIPMTIFFKQTCRIRIYFYNCLLNSIFLL